MYREAIAVLLGVAAVCLWMFTVSQAMQWVIVVEVSNSGGNSSLKKSDGSDLSDVLTRTVPRRAATKWKTTIPIFWNFSLSDSECIHAAEDQFYAAFISDHVMRIDDSMDNGISTTCEDIFRRGYYSDTPLTNFESDFPIAFARIVYKSYHMQELLLNVMYAPQNYYCYTIDAKAPALFHEQMWNLASCFPNVFVSEKEFSVDSAGHNTSNGFLECLQILKTKPRWKYAILLQNDDVPLKTNLEIVHILQALNGSNDINVGRPNKDRLPKNADWSYRALSLFYNQTKNDERQLKISKGSTSSSLSRAFVDFVVDELNLTTILKRFNDMKYGVDEMLFSSLHSDDQLDAPGGFTRHCIDMYNNLITRYVSWRKSRGRCFSGLYRHGVCVFGITDLSALRSSRALFANKMLPDYDYTAIVCWSKLIFNRTHNLRKDKMAVPLGYYKNRLPVRFHNERKKWRKDISSFNCSS